MSARDADNDRRTDALLRSPSYIPADRDVQFLQRDELRPLRLQLELLKPELIQREEGIRSTIVVFGSARLVEPAQAKEHLTRAEADLAMRPNDPDRRQAVEVGRRRLALAGYYDEARESGRLVSSPARSTACATLSSSPAGDPALWRRPTAARPT